MGWLAEIRSTDRISAVLCGEHVKAKTEYGTLNLSLNLIPSRCAGFCMSGFCNMSSPKIESSLLQRASVSYGLACSVQYIMLSIAYCLIIQVNSLNVVRRKQEMITLESYLTVSVLARVWSCIVQQIFLQIDREFINAQK